MQVQPYLNFNGRCEEAISFYKQAVGAATEMVMRWKDAPDPSMCSETNRDKIMHSAVRIGETVIFASDGRCEGTPKFDGITLALAAADEGEARRLFEALGEGGTVMMPLAKTFFSPSFGMLTDKFGVGWMVIVMQ